MITNLRFVLSGFVLWLLIFVYRYSASLFGLVDFVGFVCIFVSIGIIDDISFIISFCSVLSNLALRLLISELWYGASLAGFLYAWLLFEHVSSGEHLMMFVSFIVSYFLFQILTYAH